MDRARRRAAEWEEDYFLFIFIFFVNRFVWFFLYSVLPLIYKCKALFSYHSSSSHYSTQGFILISFHFIFSFLKNRILCNFTCDLLLSLQISDLKCGQACGKNITKNSEVNGSLRENVSIFFIAPLLSRRNVGTTSKERNQFA